MDNISQTFWMPEQCRMCTMDLSDECEYYSIDETLSDLVLTLTGILVDKNDSSLPKCMCMNCFAILNQFNDTRNVWITNQSKFDEEHIHEMIEADGVFEEEEEEEHEEYEVDTIEEISCKVEYIDDVEIDTSENQPEQVVIKEVFPKTTSSKPKTKKSNGESRAKGKEVYQRLLQKCSQCSKMIEKNRMEGHMNKHNNIRPYVCEEGDCLKTFYCKLLYRLHKTSMHTGQHVCCDVCSKTFPSERSLYAHKLRHKNEDRYNCKYCDRKFNNTNSLKRHLAIHSGIREFSCDYCTSSFYRKFNLDVHIKTVHQKDKSFYCGHCPKKFGYARLLRDHIKKNHVEIIEEPEDEYISITPHGIES